MRRFCPAMWGFMSNHDCNLIVTAGLTSGRRDATLKEPRTHTAEAARPAARAGRPFFLARVEQVGRALVGCRALPSGVRGDTARVPEESYSSWLQVVCIFDDVAPRTRHYLCCRP